MRPNGTMQGPRTADQNWLLPTMLLGLSAVPTLAGIARLVSLSTGAKVTPENARLVTAPTPLVIHVISVILFCVLGAFQFSPGFRRRRPGWHRRVGRFVALCGLLSGFSGLWMTQFRPLPQVPQGPLLYAVRMAVGTAIVTSIVLAVFRILQREIAQHRAWMIRAYALGQGAGTQVLIILPWTLVSGEPRGMTRDLLMSLAWAINFVVAEWIIRRGAKRAVGRRFPLAQTTDAQALL